MGALGCAFGSSSGRLGIAKVFDKVTYKPLAHGTLERRRPIIKANTDQMLRSIARENRVVAFYPAALGHGGRIERS